MVPDLKRRSRKISHKYNSRGKDQTNGKLKTRRDEFSKHPVKSQDHKQTVSDLVYQYLGNLANVNERRKQRHDARSIFHKAHVRKQPRDFHPDRRMVNLSSGPISNSTLKLNVPEYSPLTNRNSIEHHPRSSISRKTVDDYAKAINEGRNAARRYICKALWFAVQSGFLVPADSKEKILRVSSNLCLVRTAENIQQKQMVKKVRYNPSSLKKKKAVRQTNRKVKKRYLKPVRTNRPRGMKKKTSRRKARMY